MSLRKATLLAAAGIAAGATTEFAYNLRLFLNPPAYLLNTLWISWLYDANQVLMLVLLVMLSREMAGKGQARRRQDLALLATILSGVLLHANAATDWTRVPMIRWVVLHLLIEAAWIAFLILLVKDAAPLRGRGMRGVAPTLAVLTMVQLCRDGYLIFFRVGMAWLSLSAQRGLSGLFWTILVLPAMELFRGFSMVVFLLLLWRYSWKRV